MEFLFFTPFLKGTAFKPGSIISNQNSQGAKICEDVLPHEFHHFSSRDSGKGLGLNPFVEEVDGDHQ